MINMKGIKINIKNPLSWSTKKRWCPNGCGKRVYNTYIPISTNPNIYYLYCPICDRYFKKEDFDDE